MDSKSPNRLLSCLSTESRALLDPYLTPLTLPLHMQLYVAEQRPRYAYFVTSGLASIVMTTEDGDTAEVGMIGREGIVGGLHLLGTAKVSNNSFMKLEGTGLRLSLEDLHKIYLTSREVRGRILEFQQEQTLVVSQIAGCNGLHIVEARFARWLLMAHDQNGPGPLQFTQELIGMTLGATRTTVSVVAGALQDLGLIEFSRGRVQVVNSSGLRAIACDCYRIVNELHTALYANPSKGW